LHWRSSWRAMGARQHVRLNVRAWLATWWASACSGAPLGAGGVAGSHAQCQNQVCQQHACNARPNQQGPRRVQHRPEWRRLAFFGCRRVAWC
jgi:hypothetical protein